MHGFPCGSAGKESACNVGDLGSIPGLGRFPWRRKRLPTPVFWPREMHGLSSPWGRKESGTTEQLSLSLHDCNISQRTLSRDDSLATWIVTEYSPQFPLKQQQRLTNFLLQGTVEHNTLVSFKRGDFSKCRNKKHVCIRSAGLWLEGKNSHGRNTVRRGKHKQIRKTPAHPTAGSEGFTEMLPRSMGTIDLLSWWTVQTR